MHALTLDHLSGGRVVLGMGVSGPQVVEGWYGQPFAKPLARTREFVDIIRKVLAREEPVTNDGPHYPLPYAGDGRGRARQAAEADRAPAARRHADLAGRRGPEERRADRRDRRRLDPDLLHAEVGRHVPAVARRGLRPARRPAYPRRLRDRRDLPPAGGIAAPRRSARSSTRCGPSSSLYMGGMGAKEQNFHKPGLRADGLRATWPARSRSSTSTGEKDEATALIPDELVDDMHIIGTAGEVQERVAAVGGDRRDHAAAQLPLARRGARDRGAARVAVTF